MSLTAKDIMTANPITVTPDTSIGEASEILLENRFNGLPVVDEAGAVKGVLTQSDLVAQQMNIRLPSLFSLLGGFIPLRSPTKVEEELKRITAATVGEAMTLDARVITTDTPLEDIAAFMVADKLHTLPVVENGKLVGIVGKEDVLKTLIKSS